MKKSVVRSINKGAASTPRVGAESGIFDAPTQASNEGAAQAPAQAPIDMLESQAAYLRVRAKLGSPQVSDASWVRRPRMDIAPVVSLVLAVAPRIVAHRDAIARQLPGARLEELISLREYALALHYASSLVQQSDEPDLPLVERVEVRARKLRRSLRMQQLALVDGGALNATVFDDYAGGIGSKELASDLRLLATGLATQAAAIANRSMVTRAQLAEADALATQLLEGANRAAQAQRTLVSAEVEEYRNLYNLLVDLYSEGRICMAFVRIKERDVDNLVPPLMSAYTKPHAKGHAKARAKPAEGRVTTQGNG